MVNLKTDQEILIMKEGGQILGRIAKDVALLAVEGVELRYLDKVAHDLMIKAGGKPAFLNYRPEWANKSYPSSICASVNNVIVHGLPTRYKLQNGDLLKIDFGLIYKDFYTDIALTVGVGKISEVGQKLISVTKKALDIALANCYAGKTLGDIGYAINSYVRKNGFSVAKGLTGHGIGRRLHEEPSVFNEGQRRKGLKLEPGMVIAIEPMVSAGRGEIVQLEDESYGMQDGSLSAHFEDTVAITDGEPIVLTRVDKN